MPIATTGIEITTETQKRRVMSRSSGFSSPSSVTPKRGSSAMPQVGQVPGASRTISGCIGQVHSVFTGGAGETRSSAIPHFGQEPGPEVLTSGCIGQVYPGAVTKRSSLGEG